MVNLKNVQMGNPIGKRFLGGEAADAKAAEGSEVSLIKEDAAWRKCS